MTVGWSSGWTGTSGAIISASSNNKVFNSAIVLSVPGTISCSGSAVNVAPISLTVLNSLMAKPSLALSKVPSEKSSANDARILAPLTAKPSLFTSVVKLLTMAANTSFAVLIASVCSGSVVASTMGEVVKISIFSSNN